MKILLGSDHAGYGLKETIKEFLKSLGVFQIEDAGTFSTEPVDYPDVALKVAKQVASGSADRGILICGTGIGMSITANKVPGVFAARCEDTVSARLSRAHNNANVLTFGGRTTGPEIAKEVAKVFLETPFDGGRHERRVEKIKNVEACRLS